MENVFRFADDLGPAKIVHLLVPSVGLKAVVAIDNVAAGPAIGGVRLAPDVSTEEAFRLARAMTMKNAAAGLPHGGAKSVIYGDPTMPISEKERVIRAFADAMRDLNDYIPGPDMGTDERCMAWVKDEIGRAVGLPREVGGIPLDEIGATGYGLKVCAEVVERVHGIALEGARIAIQGFGSVGMHAARFLTQKGAVLVAVSDSKGTLVDADGLNVSALIDLKSRGGSVVDHEAGEAQPRDALIDIPCDIWIPAARPDAIHEENLNRLKAGVVLSGANIAVSEGAERILDERGVIVVPDFIANAGGVICGAVEYHGGTQALAFQTIEEKISANAAQVLETAKKQTITPRQAAVAMAEERVRAAMRYRRWG